MSKVKTRKEIASDLGIHPKTLSRWLKKYNIKVSKGLLTPEEQKVIYNKIGFRRLSE